MTEWNVTLTGDYLWSNVNFGEAVTEPMTPLAWSVLQFTLNDWVFIPGYPTVGNIGGRPYLNISIFAAVYHAMGRSRQDLLNYMEATLYMQLPPEMEIPRVPFSGWQLLANLPALARLQYRQRQGIRQMPAYLAEAPGWFQHINDCLQAASGPVELVSLWQDEIVPHVKRGVWCVLGSATHSADYAMQLRRDLTALVGAENANRLITFAPVEDGETLDSLGPLLGLEKVAYGEMTREAYLQIYGHRGPHEFELSQPRPAENPAWLERVLTDFQTNPVEVKSQLATQRAASKSAWKRLQNQHPKQVKRLQKRLSENARRIRQRERGRSAYVRDRWLIRLFALRSAELLNLGNDVFFLRLEELLACLAGADIPRDKTNDRQKEYQRYLTLPPYPSIIRGHFDPFIWAVDPQRSSDIFDGRSQAKTEKISSLHGSPGSAGRAEGRVRVILDPRDGDQLQAGEILVAVQTDISWTLLFPRAAAVITDVGAPLSHAAIVARELGIPAVVGCGNATQVLKTGDMVFVDGSAGKVEIR